ncbi:hypothetical protein L6452_26364 [Arctium lappa]|uniref:Uncharacterized protein n=1 Tax=Arctium lappa TaxID=4217 RepID=A0ACB9ACP9_ARCLA|nr:hypothetical protein L6452_26364 [Arctium lappa]
MKVPRMPDCRATSALRKFEVVIGLVLYAAGNSLYDQLPCYSKPTGLRKFFCAHCDGETLADANSKLGNVIKDKLESIDRTHNWSRCPRSSSNELGFIT